MGFEHGVGHEVLHEGEALAGVVVVGFELACVRHVLESLGKLVRDVLVL
jgi:hypothetical protein